MKKKLWSRILLLFIYAFSISTYSSVNASNGNEHSISSNQVLLAEDKKHGDDRHGHDEHASDGDHTEHHDDHADHCDHPHAFNAGDMAVHHIADANIYSIGPLNIPLPCIVWVKKEGVKVFSSSIFKPGHHGNGHYAKKGFVLNGGSLNRIVGDENRSSEGKEVCYFGYAKVKEKKKDKDGNEVIDEKKVSTVVFKDGSEYHLESKTTLDGGLFGGSITSFVDFSFTKNVVSMLIVFLLLAWMFLAIAKAYQKRDGNAPKGIQSFIEPIFLFIQDEVSKPILGHSWEKYNPFLMALFFFILGLNLFGLVPFFGGSNVTGNISVTIALSIFTFFVVNLSGNANYWQHVFWMPGVPAPVKLILTPVEVLGVFLKPITLFIRLFGNISAGHMVILIFTSLIFIFGNKPDGSLIPGGFGMGVVMSTLLGMFMMALELLVAFLQAFVFTILSAVYIGSAIEDHH